MFQRIKQFLLDVRQEFKKITWPTREQTIKQTGVVLFLTALTSVFLGIIDYGLSELVKIVIG
jgi:preprotein translocase subunit SecE